MGRFVNLMFLFLFIFASCLPHSGFAQANRVVEQAVSSSVVIEIELAKDEWFVLGSGTVIRQFNVFYFGSHPKFAILTARHVMKASDDLALRACSDIDREACVSLGDYTHGGPREWEFTSDWAIVPINSLVGPMKPARLSSKPLGLGESIYLIGHPYQDFFVAQGIVGNKKGKPGNGIVYVHSYTAPGSSGGGVFDSRGRLRGIIVAVAREEDLFGYPFLVHEVGLIVPLENVVW